MASNMTKWQTIISSKAVRQTDFNNLMFHVTIRLVRTEDVETFKVLKATG